MVSRTLHLAHSRIAHARWLTITAFVAFIRLFIFRTVIDVNKNNVKLQAIQPQMLEIQRRMKEATARKDTAEQQQCALAIRALLTKHNVNPLKALKVPLMQFPIFISMFYGLQRMAAAPIPGFLEGGFGWVTDLTVSDPYYILPLTSVALTNWVIRVRACGPGRRMDMTDSCRSVRMVRAEWPRDRTIS
jgi:YidC/Oxa1 family membrane protein insertase